MLNHRRIQFGDKPNSAAPDRLILSECFDIQETLSDESLDLIYIDPPFGTGTVRRAPESEKQYQDLPDDPDAFVEWIAPCLEHSRRLLTSSGSLFVHLDYRSIHYIKVYLDRLFGRQNFVNEIIWCYSVGGRSKKRFGRKHDTILWYSKTRNYAFFPESIAIPRKPSSHMRVVQDENGDLVQEKTDKKTGKVYRYPINRGKIPEDWWTDIETLNRSDKQRVGWPTQKPGRLLERIIKSTTVPGQRVADWFCGSGTTAWTAQALRRSFITTDRMAEAVQCAELRLQKQGVEMAHNGDAPNDLCVESPLAHK